MKRKSFMQGNPRSTGSRVGRVYGFRNESDKLEWKMFLGRTEKEELVYSNVLTVTNIKDPVPAGLQSFNLACRSCNGSGLHTESNGDEVPGTLCQICGGCGRKDKKYNLIKYLKKKNQ